MLQAAIRGDGNFGGKLRNVMLAAPDIDLDVFKTQIDEMMSNAPAAEQAKSWTEMQNHMNMIADALSDGIAKQFPDKAK